MFDGRVHFNYICVFMLTITITCATQLYESGEFDEPTIMAKTGHRSTAASIRSYKRPSDELLQKVSDALQAPMSPIASREKVESNEVIAKRSV